MNTQELIKKYKRLEGVWNAPGAETARQIFLQDLEQLDEPEKVVIPQFVADWYEENKDVFEANLYRCSYNIPSVFDGAKLNEFERWFLTAGTKPFQTLVNMHQFGYEVEKEKIYTVKVKAILGQYLGRYYLNNEELTPQFTRTQLTGKEKLPTFTHKELEEAGFGWVFDCEGIEIEEVE